MAQTVLILGVAGMLGNATFRLLFNTPNFIAFGSMRTAEYLRYFTAEQKKHIYLDIDADNIDGLTALFGQLRPDIVINCIGLVKQLAHAEDPMRALPINSVLPHRLARLCGLIGARLIHMSTDCVFSGKKGHYAEGDFCDATDLYGRSKLLGEVDYPHAVTLRTSIIGHELNGSRSLINWFLSQSGTTKGFKKAVFSGLPTVEMARIIRDHVVPFPELHGLYHVSADPINKFDLLTLVAKTYGKTIEIQADESLVIDRSLDSSRFRKATGFSPAPWPELVRRMHEFG